MGEIDVLLAAALRHRSGSLLLHGEAGIGKSALLDYARDTSRDMTVLLGAGHQSEAHLPYGLLDQLTRPLRLLTDRIPGPQSRALASALGWSEEPLLDRFLVSAALLSLLAEAAEDRPVLCVVDDIQWVDPASLDAVGFVARRLEAEGIVILMAQRIDADSDLSIHGVADCRLSGLEAEDALALIREQPGDRTDAWEERLLTNSGGNPLALIELPSLLDTSAFGAGTSLPAPLPVGAGIRRAFSEQVSRLSADAQALLVVAAADPEASVADVGTVGGELGISAGAIPEAELSGLVETADGRFRFRHPLVRAVVYHEASVVLKQRVHAAFAHSLRSERQSERQVWHSSLATSGPEESVAAALQSAGERSRTRGALEASSRAFERAAELSESSQVSARRMTDAAESAQLGGQPERARWLIEQAGHLNQDDLVGVELDELRGRLELRTGVPTDAHAFLTSAARRVVDDDPSRAVRLLTEAGEAASYAGDRNLLMTTGQQAADLLERVSGVSRLPALVLFGSGKVVSGEAERGRSICREAVELGTRAIEARDLVWASIAAQYLGDEATQHGLAVRAASAARSSGQVAMLPYALEFQGLSELAASRFEAARSTATEGLSLARELKQQNSVGRHLATLAWLDAAQGHEQDCRERSDEVLHIAAARGLGLQAASAHWALGLLELTLGRPEEAYRRLSRLLVPGHGESHPGIALLATPDLVESAVRTDQSDAARNALTPFERFAGAAAPHWARALAARSRSVVDGDRPEVRDGFENALVLHRGARRPWDEARTELLYGEHLRRTRRRVDARPHLRRAGEEFKRLGAVPWEVRAQAELRATGETRQGHDVGSDEKLTPQEFQIVTLVASGLSNRDVAAHLFLSPRTVEYHLGKVYSRLGVASRAELSQLKLDAALTGGR
jgi:DNA-binding CsgD family transcriptional regulator